MHAHHYAFIIQNNHSSMFCFDFLLRLINSLLLFLPCEYCNLSFASAYDAVLPTPTVILSYIVDTLPCRVCRHLDFNRVNPANYFGYSTNFPEISETVYFVLCLLDNGFALVYSSCIYNEYMGIVTYAT